ncbi:chemotaxis protein MotB [Roseovarius nanhaiticus]|uniref:Chemotaxis protein MotB n=1 Tax=Roseovarius nanhaiticus TaxID=573024 RepID=A0A1N7HL67_9RHOB|nr:flagellar motor protein MotB [Roseovarius nanhaiticus]SEL27598.1 chemotaxis protein MotB [Roseovarius nanhaiticus]SIS25619.1 chemotaxis protein MotB [Roseovarius nanhaiticus]
MSAQGNAAPVIIKRKKVVAGGGHHGGAWKVAYADFVTAMMAFFLLMWLLNATTEKQRKGLADYFSPVVPISRVSSGGDGHFGGESVMAEDTLSSEGVGASSLRATEARMARGQTGTSADAGLEELQRKIDEALTASSGESTVASELRRHIITRVTDEGLVVEFFDVAQAPLFAEGGAVAAPILTQLAKLLVDVGAMVTNAVAIEAHTRAAPIVLKENRDWDITTERAQVMRTLLKQQGLAQDRVARVTGHADRDPAVRNPMAVRNNRIEVIFLRQAE